MNHDKLRKKGWDRPSQKTSAFTVLSKGQYCLFHLSLQKATGQPVPGWASLGLLLLPDHPLSEEGFLGSLEGNTTPPPVPWGGMAGPCQAFLLPFLCGAVTGGVLLPSLPCFLQTRAPGEDW